jgi:hypothetical protein
MGNIQVHSLNLFSVLWAGRGVVPIITVLPLEFIIKETVLTSHISCNDIHLDYFVIE